MPELCWRNIFKNSGDKTNIIVNLMFKYSMKWPSTLLIKHVTSKYYNVITKH